MKSANADKFNHDNDAAGYDRDVADESNPIRAGYDRLLNWVASHIPSRSQVIDLGCGTGNLALRLESPAKLICIDISANMIAIARAKLDGDVKFIQADLLECFDALPVVDAIVSTYAIHHLTTMEKARLFAHVFEHLRPGGKAVFGDLMFESAGVQEETCEGYEQAGNHDLAADIRDEFLWALDEAIEELTRIGFEARAERFSDLSWGVVAERPQLD